MNLISELISAPLAMLNKWLDGEPCTLRTSFNMIENDFQYGGSLNKFAFFFACFIFWAIILFYSFHLMNWVTR